MKSDLTSLPPIRIGQKDQSAAPIPRARVSDSNSTKQILGGTFVFRGFCVSLFTSEVTEGLHQRGHCAAHSHTATIVGKGERNVLALGDI